MQQTSEIIGIRQAGGMLISYPVTDAAISELSKRHAPLVITDTKSYKAVTDAIGEVRGYRVSVEKKRKELKKDALEYGRKVDGEAKRITALLEPIEAKLKAKKQIADDIKKAEKAKKARIEAERVDGILKKISDIQRITVGLNGLDSNQLRGIMADMEAVEISTDEYAEFQLEAKQAQADSINIIKQAIGSRVQFEEEEVSRKAEAERLEKIRIEQEAEAKRLAEEKARIKTEQEEAARIIAEAQAKIDAENARIEQEQQRLEAEKQAEIDRKEREAMEKKLAVEAKVKAEKDAKEKAEREERERVAKEEADAEETARQEVLKPDKERLIDFANALLSLVPAHAESPEAIKLADEAIRKVYHTANWLIGETRGI